MTIDAPTERDTARLTPFRLLLGFAHGERMRFVTSAVLAGVSLYARAGEVTALVGPSGAGKSTVARLAARFWDVDTGAVLVGGTDVRHIPTSQLMDAIAFVFQDTFLFHDTVAANICLARPDASRAEIERVARAARCHDFVMALPDGYDTVIGERGATLSGGERSLRQSVDRPRRDPGVVAVEHSRDGAMTIRHPGLLVTLWRLAGPLRHRVGWGIAFRAMQGAAMAAPTVVVLVALRQLINAGTPSAGQIVAWSSVILAAVLAQYAFGVDVQTVNPVVSEILPQVVGAAIAPVILIMVTFQARPGDAVRRHGPADPVLGHRAGEGRRGLRGAVTVADQRREGSA